MTMHLAAFYKSVASSSALALLSAVTDQAIYTSGNDVRVPTGLANLIGEAASTAQTGPGYAQVQSPTLRDLVNQDVEPISGSLVFTDGGQIQWHGDNPRALTAAESVNFGVYATDTSAAGNYGLIWLADGAVKPTGGKTFSMRATAAVTLSAGNWVNGSLTFNSTLPAGTYQIVGMRAEGTNLVAARLVFVGQGFRPGVPGETSSANNYFRAFRGGAQGVFGQFDVNQPPTVDCLGVTDTSQSFVFDMIKSG